MKLLLDAAFGEVTVTGTEAELTRLADLVRVGDGALTCDSTPPNALHAAEATDTGDLGVHIHVDTTRRVLVITGDPESRAILADNVDGVAQMEDGGHLHIDYFPNHYYLLPGSAPLIIESPHGGMPARQD